MKLNKKLFAVAATAIAVLAGGYALQQNYASEPISVAKQAHAEDLSTWLKPGPLGDRALGSEDAPVTIVEYASLTCGHCAVFHETVVPVLKEKYIDTGKLRLIFREFPFDPRAMAASMLARCADEQFYFPLLEVFFKQVDKWARVEDPREPLLQIAKLAGFNQKSFDACLTNQDTLDGINAVRKIAADEYGINATPSFIINGKKHVGGKTADEMSKIIDDLL